MKLDNYRYKVEHGIIEPKTFNFFQKYKINIQLKVFTPLQLLFKLQYVLNPKFFSKSNGKFSFKQINSSDKIK